MEALRKKNKITSPPEDWLPAVDLNPVKSPEVQSEWTDRLNVWNDCTFIHDCGRRRGGSKYLTVYENTRKIKSGIKTLIIHVHNVNLVKNKTMKIFFPSVNTVTLNYAQHCCLLSGFMCLCYFSFHLIASDPTYVH